MDFPATIGAGLIAGGIMTAVLYKGIFMMPGQMKMNLLYLLGRMMLGERVMIYLGGAMVHAMMSVAFALAHVGLYQAFDLETSLAAWGVLFGFGHYLISGMGLGMMPMMHPMVRSGRLQNPGLFSMGYPAATAMGFLMLHLLFGVLVGTFYEVLI